MKIKISTAAIIIIVFIFGGIAITSALGYWKTVNTKEPIRYSEGEFSGEYNPSDIRGSYSFGEISKLFNIPLEDLGKAFGIKDEGKVEAFKCKDLEAAYADYKEEGKEVGTDSVRIFTALYKSLPITLNDATYLPKSAADILKSKVELTKEQLEYLENHTILLVDADNATSTSSEAEDISGESTTQGNPNTGDGDSDISKNENDSAASGTNGNIKTTAGPEISGTEKISKGTGTGTETTIGSKASAVTRAGDGSGTGVGTGSGTTGDGSGSGAGTGSVTTDSSKYSASTTGIVTGSKASVVNDNESSAKNSINPDTINTPGASKPTENTAVTTETPKPSETSDSHNTSDSDKTIKGKTTFGELLDWGVKQEDIEKVIKDKMPRIGDKIKDYADAKKIEFSTIKEPLQELVNNINK